MSIQLAQYRELYFSEAHEQLELIAAALRKMERAPGEWTALEAAFRAAHTLKGMSATMGYDEITIFTHALEDLLQSVRQHPGDASTANIYPLFRTLDHLNRIISRLEAGQSAQDEALAAEAQLAIPAPLSAGSIGGAPGQTSSLVRVSNGQLDHEMALIVELAANAYRLAHGQANAEDQAGEARWLELLSLVQRLQAAAWSLRMAPIGEVYNRFPPMLHDLARAQGKEIRVKLEGEEVEVGRGILEEINEPLLHLLRNAVGHGLEPLAERLQAGKDPCGTIFLRARQCADSISLEVGDDGRGLDAQRILQAAYEQAFISEAARRTLGEAEAYELISLPGFSLSPSVTNVSGRGVGMDIVRAKVDALGGSLRIRSQPGLGTTFSLQIPRTLGQVEVELVRVGDQICALRAAQIERRLTRAGEDQSSPHTGGIDLSDHASRVIDLRSPPGLSACGDPETSGLLLNGDHGNIALYVDELLGKALWGKPSHDDAPTVPLLDLNQLLSK